MLVLANLIIPRDYVFRLMIFERKKFSRRKKGGKCEKRQAKQIFTYLFRKLLFLFYDCDP